MSHRDGLARLTLWAAVLAGASFLARDALALPEAAGVVWKGAGVSLLALYAALRARDLDGWLICAVMALGAGGDVLLETHGLIVGAVSFLIGHLVAIGLYLRHRRAGLSGSQRLLALLIVPATVITAFLLPTDRSAAPGIAVYATGLSAMAAMAWTSAYPRLKTGLGAMLFVVSDLLIFAGVGPLAGQAWVSPAIWVTYFGGQLLICVGVVSEIGRRREAAERDRAVSA